MTKEKLTVQKFIFLATILSLPFSCQRDRNYPSDNTDKLNPYQHYPQTYRPYSGPYSGSYRNPYNNPPRNYYPYYDSDYYYVPPTQYRNVEPKNVGGAAGKF